jgi:hypothetical protein
MGASGMYSRDGSRAFLRSVLGARMVKNRGWQQLLEWW